MPVTFTYRAPVQRSQLLSLLADHGPDARVLAGGTDLIGDLRLGLRSPAVVLDLKKVGGFSDLSWSDEDGLVIRPGVTINDIMAHEKVRESFPLLVACAEDLASHQIRNRATVIGNVVNASPCADMSPALLCLSARAVISSQSGQREVPFHEFTTGVKKTVLRPDEILEKLVIPPQAAAARGSYRKLKRIKGHDLGLVGVALAKTPGGALRLGISSCAPTPLLVEGLSQQDTADTVVAAVKAVISPISDVRCSREYREHMVETYVRRALREVA